MQEQQLIPPRPGYDLNVILYPTYSRLLQEARERYLSGYHGMDQYGAMYFETSDFRGKPVLFTDTNYVFNNEYYNTQRMKPGKCSGSVPVKLPNGQEYVLRLKIYFRTFRDILWKKPGQSEPEKDDIQDCFLGACAVPIYSNVLCCSTMFDELNELKRRWILSSIGRKIAIYLDGRNMRPIHNIVCYQLGRLGDPSTGQLNSTSLFRHLTAYLIARKLMGTQASDSRPNHEPIKLHAIDDTYNDCCHHYLRDMIGHGLSVPGYGGTYGFGIITDEFVGFLPEFLTPNTLFVTFEPRDSVLVPVFDICQEGGQGPAGLLCPAIEDQGTTPPTMEDHDTGAAHVDSSPQLFEWVSLLNATNRVFSLDDEAETEKNLQGLTYEKANRTFRPMLYYGEM